jgi:acetolactate synthase-1/2/3 large subunit
LDIKILILNNRGYLTIKHTHNALFNSDVKATACDSDSGITFPSFAKLAEVFGFEYSKITSPENLDSWLRNIVERNSTFIGEIEMPDFQELVPKSAIKIRRDGTVYSSPLEDMYPFLSQNELQSEMLIPLLEEK